MVADVFNLTVAPLYTYNVTAVTGFASTSVVANLATPQPGETITVPLGISSIVFDLAAAKTIKQVAFLYSNFTNTNKIRVTGSLNADGITDFLFDTGQLVVEALALKRPLGQRHWFYDLPSEVVCRYLRVEFDVNGARTLGVAVFSDPLQLEYNVDYGDTSWGYDEADEGEELDSGVEVLVEKAARPVLNFTASWVTQAEMDSGWEELGRLQHEATPVLVARRPDPHAGRHNGLYYGILRMVPIVAAEFDMFEVQGRIRSMV
jgi:hypothetical protein